MSLRFLGIVRIGGVRGTRGRGRLGAPLFPAPLLGRVDRVQLSVGKRETKAVRPLVERPPAVLRSTQAGDLVVLQGELVVVGDLLIEGDGLLRVDHNLLLGLYGDDLGVAVWLKEQEKHYIT